MIGLVASLVSGVSLEKPALFLAVIPYALSLRHRNLSLIAFYLYALLLIAQSPGESLYSWEGLKTSVLLSASTLLLLDDVLRGARVDRETLIISGVLVMVSLSDYSLTAGLVGVVAYRAYKNFGRTAGYLYGWAVLLCAVLYGMRERLQEPTSQALVIAGLGLLTVLLAERKEVKFLEVNLLEED